MTYEDFFFFTFLITLFTALVNRENGHVQKRNVKASAQYMEADITKLLTSKNLASGENAVILQLRYSRTNNMFVSLFYSLWIFTVALHH